MQRNSLAGPRVDSGLDGTSKQREGAPRWHPLDAGGADPRLHAPSDADLVVDVSEGSAAAMEELFHRHGSAIRLAVSTRCGWPLAEDAVQEVFVRLWERPERFDPSRGSLRSFLVTDGVARAIDRWRSENSSRQRSEAHARQAPLIEQGPDDLGIAFDAREAVQVCLAQLSAIQREAIQLAYYAGVTYRDVARQLGITEGMAKWRIRSALSALRSMLDDAGWNPTAE